MSESRTRGFEVVKGYESKNINLPIQMTQRAAGYDIEAAEDIIIPPIWQEVYRTFKRMLKNKFIYYPDANFLVESNNRIQPTKIPTGIKAYMLPNEMLALYNRSSNPLKLFLMLVNGVAVIDADYYNNKDNDGHIHVPMINFGFRNCRIKKGDRVAQGIFQTFLCADSNACRKTGDCRVGGEGSTN